MSSVTTAQLRCGLNARTAWRKLTLARVQPHVGGPQGGVPRCIVSAHDEGGAGRGCRCGWSLSAMARSTYPSRARRKQPWIRSSKRCRHPTLHHTPIPWGENDMSASAATTAGSGQCGHFVWRWWGATLQGIGTVEISSDASYFGKMLGFAGISKAAFETDVRHPPPPPPPPIGATLTYSSYNDPACCILLLLLSCSRRPAQRSLPPGLGCLHTERAPDPRGWREERGCRGAGRLRCCGGRPTPPTHSWLRLARRTRQRVHILPHLHVQVTVRTCSPGTFAEQPATFFGSASGGSASSSCLGSRRSGKQGFASSR